MATESFGLHDLYQQVKSVAYGIWRKRWFMMATTWLICLVGWGLVATLPYRYESSAQIFVETKSALPSIVPGLDVDVNKRINFVKKTLVTRSNLEKIIRRSEYLERLASNEGTLNQLIATMQDDIGIISLDGDMYRIQFETSDRRLSDRQRAEVARNVVTNLLAFFLEGGADSGDAANENAQQFLDDQIADYAARLNAAETAHAKFKQDNLAYIGGQTSFLTRLDQAKENLRSTRNEIGELNVALTTLQEQIQNVPATIQTAVSSRNRGGGDEDPLQSRISELERTLDKLRTLGYTDRHPDVVNVLRQLGTLKAQADEKQAEIAAELADSANAGRRSNSSTETPNRLYEQLMFNIIDTTTKVKTLGQREIEQQRTVGELEEQAKRVPEIEAQESQLLRDFKQVRDQYQVLLGGKQDLQLSIDVNDSNESVSLRVVEQPSLPTRPSGPNRTLFMSGILMFALMAGVGFALVLSVLRPVVLTVDQLRMQFDLNILGNVSRSLSEEETRQRSMELLMFAGTTVMLFVVFSGFIVFDMIGSTG